ncbi:MAG: 50S ribosomal protein L6 [Candidatus Moranbacteria bacterium RIFOXYA12_FULL_35_19]|nr:MAG: 50S ribosomal protein L6 [Candidatus Moranbacteria bacterium GW2011_GWF2_35_39]OGI31650.1 MAG: 50S ribosomal protein L6 [Candidatus Moranbacteria bacterium RIFOXYB12_FULL_35_8]OGI32820.1 MAG: 50S ribosomal protein L6 [Candidatus Moranbacteria bacterium RIFOXYC12_FULL_36_13]OGI36148.1 MAG: 50S ribosomal protein L6 [Candidatus Moranbacteria bacterium RIFOXYA12_FULL_35_19]PIP28627.1 MAG: 50S ribosomal protein L6 [Candidatus Moranbacteria bacterium CG23_combo_of_CG06-09_8_20_14_all_35_22]
MSKIGKKTIIIPQGIEVKLEKEKLFVKGPKGTLELEVNQQAKIDISENEINVSKIRNTKEANAIWGLTRALISNMIVGAKDGYEKKLELQGVGFRMSLQGKKIVMALGFSHPVEVEIPEGLTVKLEENNVISISGADKQKVGQFSANIRALKKVEPYKGKGFRYQGEKVRRKVGKKAGAVK